MNSNLTSLSAVKAWIGSNATGVSSAEDPLLKRLISSNSRFLLNYLQRPTLFQNLYSEIYDGCNTRVQMLRNWPVLSVSSLTIGLQKILPATGYGSGFVLDPWDGFPPGRPQALTLRGHEFWRGNSNVSISYTAGFIVQNEPQTVPASAPYDIAVDAKNGNWGADQGVTYADGTPLVPIKSGTPTVGQYVAPTDATAFYQFATADAGADVLISYSYIPADIEDACINMVGERYSYKGRIGYVSKSLSGQETVAFSQKDMPDYIRTNLQPYRRVLPV